MDLTSIINFSEKWGLKFLKKVAILQIKWHFFPGKYGVFLTDSGNFLSIFAENQPFFVKF